MTRIKYNKSLKDVLSAGPFITSNGILVLYITTDTLIYMIVNEEKNLKQGQANSLPSLKKKAKQALRELGCTFYDEIRKKDGVEVISYE